MNFTILWYSRKFSLRNLGGVAPLALQKHEQSVKVFSAKIVSFYQFAKVLSFESFPLYST